MHETKTKTKTKEMDLTTDGGNGGLRLCAEGGTVLATLSAVAPVVCFAVAALVGARVMDSLLPAPALTPGEEEEEEEEERERNAEKMGASGASSNAPWTKLTNDSGGGGGGGKNEEAAVVDQDLAEFDKRLYGWETSALLRTPPHSSALLRTPLHSSALLRTPPHSSTCPLVRFVC